MENPNAIKQYKSAVDKQGNYRIYTVYSSGEKFIFECWDCAETPRQGGVGTRKGYDEYPDLTSALTRFEEYIRAWEPDAPADLS